MDIKDIRQGMGNVDIKGKIVDMNRWMLSVNDRTGQIFVRYRRNYRTPDKWQKLQANLKIGKNVKITNCEVVFYHGILQLELARKGEVFSLKPKTELSGIYDLER